MNPVNLPKDQSKIFGKILKKKCKRAIGKLKILKV